jgi:preprotein translocase subunit SecB
MSTAVQIDPEYTQFLQSVELISISIVHSSFRIRRDEYLRSEDTQNEARLRCTPIEVGDGSFDLRATLKLTASSEHRPLVRLFATYELHFHSKNVTRERVERFASNEVRVVIWPFFREYVASATARMHVPPIILPIAGDQT